MRTKNDQRWTKVDQEAHTYLTNLKLRPCGGCMRVRRQDIFRDDGTCLYCHGEMTTELELKLKNEALLVKRLRRKLKRLNGKQRPNVKKVLRG